MSFRGFFVDTRIDTSIQCHCHCHDHQYNVIVNVMTMSFNLLQILYPHKQLEAVSAFIEEGCRERAVPRR